MKAHLEGDFLSWESRPQLCTVRGTRWPQRSQHNLWHGSPHSPRVARQTIPCTSNQVRSKSHRNGYSLDGQSGKLLWKHDLGKRATTKLSVIGNSLYVGNSTNRLFRMSVDDGHVQSELSVPAPPEGRILVEAPALYVFLEDRNTRCWQGLASVSAIMPSVGILVRDILG